MKRIKSLHETNLHLLRGLALAHQEVKRLRQSNQDLQISLSTTAEHGDLIHAQVHALNLQLKAKADEQQRTSAQLTKLLDIMSQEKEDLEMVLQTLTEHGDAVDEQWQNKLEDAVSLASLDALTQIANRRRFDEHLTQQWKQMAREKESLAILICDIDYFKQYNDLYGHLTGDACLTQVAQAMAKSVFRPIDLVARYGGEEFSVILPKTHAQGAIQVADRIQKAVADLAIPHARSSVSSSITLSIGIAHTIPQANQPWSELLELADQALYQSKENGRNQISIQFDHKQEDSPDDAPPPHELHHSPTASILTSH